MDPRYLDLEDLLRIIELEDIGPVRDLGLLDSAAARPRSSAFGVEAYTTLPEKAAALLDSIVGNHALVDGNKRTAFASLLFFYDLNDMRLTLSHDDAFDLVIGVVTHEVDIERAAKILQDHAVRR